MKREAELKSAFGEELKRQLPSFMSLRLSDAGAPDRAVVGLGRTTFWEFKHATPDFDSTELQELMCMRLDAHGGCCRYVIWQESAIDDMKRTLIVTPKKMHERRGWALDPESWCVGFDHAWLIDQIMKRHYNVMSAFTGAQ